MKSTGKIQRQVIIVIIATALLLMIPLLAMQFETGVDWSIGDFFAAGILLGGTGLTYVFLASRAGSNIHRYALGLTLVTALFMVWANLAVGLVGSEDNPFNAVYLGVLLVGLIGSVLARFKTRGMVLALAATALAQITVTVIAFVAGMDKLPGSSAMEIINVNGFFFLLWLISAALFRYADRKEFQAAE